MGVDTIYGIPSEHSSLMDALADGQRYRFLQGFFTKRDGCSCSGCKAKFGGSIGVAVGSGWTVQLTDQRCLWRMTAPFLAILGSRPVNELNMDAFQELNQNPMYNGIAVYNKRVAYADNCQKRLTKLAVLPFLKRSSCRWNSSANFGFQKSTKTHTTDQVHTSVHSSLLLWTSWNRQSCWNFEQRWTSSYLYWLRWC